LGGQPKWRVVRSHSISVQHNLIVRHGVRKEDVKWVGSHEQVSSMSLPSKKRYDP
jgi:prephenate dehydratase